MTSTREKRARRIAGDAQEEEVVRVHQRDDEISDISKESTIKPKKKKPKTRNNVSVTIECITKLDKESVKKLQQQRETLSAQGIAENYPIQNSISPKLFDTVALFLHLNKTIEKMYDMTKEEDVKKFAVYLQENEKTVVNLLVQHFINNTKNEDISMKLKQMFPKISPNTDSFVWYLNFTTIVNDNNLEPDEQLGVIAVHKQNFLKSVKGPSAVKEVMKEQIFQDDEKHGKAPRNLMEYAKKFVAIQKEREDAYKKTLARGDKYDLRDYYEARPTHENGAGSESGHPRYKGKNYQQTKDMYGVKN